MMVSGILAVVVAGILALVVGYVPALVVAAVLFPSCVLLRLWLSGEDRNLPVERGHAILRLCQTGEDSVSPRQATEISELLAQGADLRVSRPQDGRTALMMVCDLVHAGRLDYRLARDGWYVDCEFSLVELLIEHGADVNARDMDGWTPLILASKYAWDEKGCGSGKLSRALVPLLQAGADVHARTSKGLTALMMAAGTEMAGAVTTLLEWGADADALDSDNKSAAGHAVDSFEGRRADMLRNVASREGWGDPAGAEKFRDDLRSLERDHARILGLLGASPKT